MDILLFWILPVAAALIGLKGHLVGAWRRFLVGLISLYLGVWCAPLWWSALDFLPEEALPYRNALAVFAGVAVLFAVLLYVSLALSPVSHEETFEFPRVPEVVLNIGCNFGFGVVLSTFVFVLCCATPLRTLFPDDGANLQRRTEAALLKLTAIGDAVTRSGRKTPRAEELAAAKLWHEPPVKEEAAAKPGEKPDQKTASKPDATRVAPPPVAKSPPVATPPPVAPRPHVPSPPPVVEVAVIADELSKVYGERDPELTYTLNRVVPPGVIRGTLTRVAGEDVGKYPITRGTLGTTDGYRIRGFGQKDFTITPRRLSVSVDDATFTYNGMEQHPVKYRVDGLAPGDSVAAVTIGGVRDAGVYDVTAGAVTIRNVRGDDVTKNYDVAFVRRPGNVVVNPREITIAADPQRKICGDADPPLTCTVRGLIPGDALQGGLVRAPGENVGKYPITQGTIDAGPNYRLMSFTGAEFTIAAPGN